MKVGRPSKYDPSFIDIAKKYINDCGREATELPTIEGLALLLKVDDERIRDYADAKVKDTDGNETEELLHPEFNATIKELKSKQKNQLMNDGLYGGKEVNSTMAIFLLKANHGMIETEKRILAGDSDEPVRVNMSLDQMLDKIYGDKP